MPRDPFAILNISENSSPEEVKKAFHQLIQQYHPDLQPSQDHQIAAQLIAAYQKARKIAEEKARETWAEFLNNYKTRFRKDYDSPKTIQEFCFYLKSFFKNLKLLIYQKTDQNFYWLFSQQMIADLLHSQNNGDHSWQIGLLSAFAELIKIRKNILATQSSQDYQFDTLRQRIEHYYHEVMNKKNYLDFRFYIYSEREYLIKDLIYFAGKNIPSELKDEFFQHLLILMIFTDESYLDHWYHTFFS
ncbi:MAG: DnaJ domain-containing protein [Spirochaetes bacterium]|nr:DnaJ domain-containing protein [Spirochaetota bacterium]